MTLPPGDAEPLGVASPTLDPAAAAALTEAAFGVVGAVSEVGGERGQNFRIDTGAAEGYDAR